MEKILPAKFILKIFFNFPENPYRTQLLPARFSNFRLISFCINLTGELIILALHGRFWEREDMDNIPSKALLVLNFRIKKASASFAPANADPRID